MMNYKLIYWIVLAILSACLAAGAESPVFLREDFATLEGWRPLEFPKIAAHTTYSVTEEGTNRVLKAEARASASGLIHTNTFNVRRTPMLRWRWKADNVFKKGNAARKDGDDYPLRVYVIFKYDPGQAGFGLRAKSRLAKALYGEYPPHSSLNYIWANRDHARRILPSPYTDRSRMVVLRAGTNDIGHWVAEEVNIVADYRAAFGADPPPEALLAIMCDADNTGESATAFVDYIEVRTE